MVRDSYSPYIRVFCRNCRTGRMTASDAHYGEIDLLYCVRTCLSKMKRLKVGCERLVVRGDEIHTGIFECCDNCGGVMGDRMACVRRQEVLDGSPAL